MDAQPQQANGTAQSSKQTTERIQALAEISKKIPHVLQHAALAVSALTRNPLPTDAIAAEETGDLAKNKHVFKENFAAFLSILNDVTNSLLNETDELVNAKLLPEKPAKKGVLGAEIINEGLGNLDVGYLNSRTRDVGLAKEKELVGELKTILGKLVERQEKAKSNGKDEEDEVMDEI